MKPVLDYLDKRIEEIKAKADIVEKEGMELRSQGKNFSVHSALYNQLLGALIELKRTRGEILAGSVEGFRK